MTTTLDVDDICTDADLAKEVGGSENLARAMPTQTDRDAMRTAALDDVVNELSKRSPPIFESDLATPGELKNAVVYCALERIYAGALTSDADVHSILMRRYASKYQNEIKRSFTVTGNLVGPSGGSFRMERR